MTRPYVRIPRSWRGPMWALLLALLLTWVPYWAFGLSGRTDALVQSAVVVGLVLASVICPRTKVRVIRVLQRLVVNPLMRLMLTIGINPFGLVVLETTGARTGIRRRVPIGARRTGATMWAIAEHAYGRDGSATSRRRQRSACGSASDCGTAGSPGPHR